MAMFHKKIHNGPMQVQHHILQLMQENVFLYCPNPSRFPTSLNLFQCCSAPYADRVQHCILQLMQEDVFLYCPNPSPFPTSLDLFRCHSADQVQHGVLQLIKKMSSSITPILCNHSACFKAVRPHVQLQLTQENGSLYHPNPSPQLGLFQHRSTPFNPANHVQHHILQLTQEDVFLCHPILQAQLLPAPFDPMLIKFGIMFSNRCKKLWPLSVIDRCSCFPFPLLHIANLLFSSLFLPHTASCVSYEGHDRITVHLKEIQVCICLPSIYLLPSLTPRCQRFSQLPHSPPPHPKSWALEFIKPLVDNSTILKSKSKSKSPSFPFSTPRNGPFIFASSLLSSRMFTVPNTPGVSAPSPFSNTGRSLRVTPTTHRALGLQRWSVDACGARSLLYILY